MNDFKCVVVGDGSVGKTCLLVSYTKNTFPSDYVPTLFDQYTASLMVDERPVNLGLWDTAGQEEFERLRPMTYKAVDVFLMCYSVAQRSTLLNVQKKWLPEIRMYTGDVPFVLVGTKLDLREKAKNGNNSNQFVQEEEGKRMATAIGAFTFIECSALTQKNLKKVFDEICRCVFDDIRKGNFNQGARGGQSDSCCCAIC